MGTVGEAARRRVRVVDPAKGCGRGQQLPGLGFAALGSGPPGLTWQGLEGQRGRATQLAAATGPQCPLPVCSPCPPSPPANCQREKDPISAPLPQPVTPPPPCIPRFSPLPDLPAPAASPPPARPCPPAPSSTSRAGNSHKSSALPLLYLHRAHSSNSV